MGVHSFEDLIHHVGHKISCVVYGNINSEKGNAGSAQMYNIANVAVECEDCNMVLMDFDRVPENKGEDIEHTVMTHLVECNRKELLSWLELIQRELKER